MFFFLRNPVSTLDACSNNNITIITVKRKHNTINTTSLMVALYASPLTLLILKGSAFHFCIFCVWQGLQTTN